MSDCSTAAMKPKEQPKKCGTCYWMMMQPGHGECGACGNPMRAQAHDPVAYANGFYEYTTVYGDCRGEFWEPRTDTIKQRYQQLEQVAKEMLGDFGKARTLAFEGQSANALTVISLSTNFYKDKLEALGVFVDD